MDMTLHVEAYVGQFKYYATMLIIQKSNNVPQSFFYS